MWQSRITRHAEVAPHDLVQNPMNYRVHTQEQDETLTALLQQVGWVDDVIVAEGSNLILDGHLRVAIALREGEPVVPVGYVNLTPDEERLVLATYDQVTRMASLNAVKVDTVLRQIDTDQPAIQSALDKLSQFAGLTWDGPDDATMSWAEEPDEDVDGEPDDTDAVDDASTQVRVGDYLTLVPRTVCEGWVDEMRYAVGFSEHDINAAILERLMTDADS